MDNKKSKVNPANVFKKLMKEGKTLLFAKHIPLIGGNGFKWNNQSIQNIITKKNVPSSEFRGMIDKSKDYDVVKDSNVCFISIGGKTPIGTGGEQNEDIQ